MLDYDTLALASGSIFLERWEIPLSNPFLRLDRTHATGFCKGA